MDRPDSPYYPYVVVQMGDLDGNAFAIIGKVKAAMRNIVPTAKVAQFMDEAMSSDYDNLLRTCMKWVTVE